MEGVPLQVVPLYEKCPLMRSVPLYGTSLWKVVPLYARCLSMGGTPLSMDGRCTFTRDALIR